MPVAGWAVASTSTLAIPTFFFDLVVIPHLPFEKSEAAEAFFRKDIQNWKATVQKAGVKVDRN